MRTEAEALREEKIKHLLVNTAEWALHNERLPTEAELEVRYRLIKGFFKEE